MNRRQFIRRLSSVAASASVFGPDRLTATTGNTKGRVMSVLGPVTGKELGFTLTHEHILVDFVGADQIQQGGYDYDQIASRAVPHLQELKALGVDTLVECTPAYIGRDAELLKRLSRETGVRLVTNTGYYGAQNGKFVPSEVQRLSPMQLAERWIKEATDGIGTSGVYPGFIKTAVNPGPLQELDRKLIRAAAMAHRQTGLTIHSHTSRTAVSGLQQLDILKQEGVHPSAWVWVHAQGISELEELRPAFEAGAWISFDNLRPDSKSLDRMLRCLKFAKSNDWLDQVLISHDAGWFDPGKPDGGPHRPYTAYFTHLLPALDEAGVTPGEMEMINRKNAFEAMKIRVRRI